MYIFFVDFVYNYIMITDTFDNVKKNGWNKMY